MYLPGFGPEDAGLDIGDSTITETTGIGGFAMAAAPAIVLFVGGEVSDALDNTLRMYEITLAEHPFYKVPILAFRGTPTGIDATLVVRSGVLPSVNTGIAGREPGVGQVGAGLVVPPMSVFVDATRALARRAAAANGDPGASSKGASMNEIFKYRAPDLDARSCSGCLADHGDGAKVLAGGTDLLVDMRSGLCRPEMVINLKKVEDFSGLSWSQSDGLVIGPAVDGQRIARRREGPRLLPLARRVRPDDSPPTSCATGRPSWATSPTPLPARTWRLACCAWALVS